MNAKKTNSGVYQVIGRVHRVIGPVVEVADIKDAQMLELVEVGTDRLIGEIVRLEENKATAQVYEDTTGLAPGEDVYGSGMPLSCELGPGLIGTIFDGIQRPLVKIRELSGQFISKGVHVPNLDRNRKWHFVPSKGVGEEIPDGEVIGTVQETELIEHRILVPVGSGGVLRFIAGEGDYTLDEIIAKLDTGKSRKELRLYQTLRRETAAFNAADYRPACHRYALPACQRRLCRRARRLRHRQDNHTARNSEVVRCRYDHIHRMRRARQRNNGHPYRVPQTDRSPHRKAHDGAVDNYSEHIEHARCRP